MAGIELPVKAIREQIAGGFDLLVHIGRLVDGSRRVTQITEVAGMEGDVVTLQDLFVARSPEFGAEGGTPLLGPLRSTALRPGFVQKLAANGVDLPPRPGSTRHEAGTPHIRLARRARGTHRGGRGRPRDDSRRRARRVPSVQLTAVVPQGSKPALTEDGRPAGYVEARELGSAQAIVLAVDNSSSMSGRPLREAKRAAGEFLAGRNPGTVGLVAFGHEALTLTAPAAPESDVDRVLASLAPDAETGTALYDAVRLSVAHLRRMEDGTRVLVLHGWARPRLEEHARAGDRRREARQRDRLRDRGRLQVGWQAPRRARLGYRRPTVRFRPTRLALARRTAPLPGSSTEHGGSRISRVRKPVTRTALTVRSGGATAHDVAADSDGRSTGLLHAIPDGS